MFLPINSLLILILLALNGRGMDYTIIIIALYGRGMDYTIKSTVGSNGIGRDASTRRCPMRTFDRDLGTHNGHNGPPQRHRMTEATHQV